MSTDTLTLTDFLLARIAEDEAVAESATGEPVFQGLQLFSDGYGTDVIARSRRGTLAECEAKRRIVEWHFGKPNDGGPYCANCGSDWPCENLAALALPYADHPDFREEWRP
jgi:hypothetical protein